MISRFKLQIGSGFALLLSLLIFLGRERLLVCLLAACAVHEAGHIAAIFITGGQIESITLGFTGISIKRAMSQNGYLYEAAVAGAGPAAGLLFAAAASRFNGGEMTAGISLCLSVINLMPCAPLDGGIILDSLISNRFGPCVSRRVLQVSSYITSLILLSAAILSAINGFGLLPMITGTWLLIYTIKNHGT